MIVFLHGKESTAETTSSGKFIKEYFKDEVVLIPEYNSKGSYVEIYNSLCDTISSLNDENIILIGISLGGFWAHEMYNICTDTDKCILINPALEYYKSPIRFKGDRHLTILMNKDDDIVDNQKTYDLFKDRAKCVMFESGGHRCSNMNEICVEIEKSINAMAI